MKTIDSIQSNIDGETKNANIAMNVVLHGLVHEGFITEEQYVEITNNYVLVLHKPNWFLSKIQKMIGINAEQWYYSMVKIVMGKPEEDLDGEKKA